MKELDPETIFGLQKFAMKLTKHVHNAEDLLHDTIVKMLENKTSFMPGTSAFRWGSRIMYNHFATGYRRTTKRETQYDPEFALNKLASAPRQETILALEEARSAMLCMPGNMKRCLRMAGDGYDYEEIAQKLDLPVGTVRSTMSRARAELTQRLNA